MIVERSKTFKLDNEELTTIFNSARVLDDIVWNLQEEEELCIDGTYYDRGFVTDVFNFLCDLRGHGTLTVEKV